MQQADCKAFSYLYDAYSPVLYGVLLRIVKHRVVAEDLLQEAFLKIFHSFYQYDSSKGKLFTWLVSIVRHLAIDKIRSRSYLEGKKTRALLINARVEKYCCHTFRPDHIGIKTLTDKLPAENKTIIDLMYFEGYSQSEIAKKLSLPLGTVKSRARKGLQLLKSLV
ncbi:RNA polymerase sigma factor [Adhaeribacter swui]|uniref:RNA polymerase sigma factor n=1 Tax=Adhaeribacter swui TaxID=2086471 RepID=UPI001E31E8F1|nr:sigma-70 family RNA polymerase sigma factor [Adhaeribacter swui]